MIRLPLTFTVYGVPIPKGSAKGFKHRSTGRVIVTHDNPRTKSWQQAVLEAAQIAMGFDPPVDGPVALTLRFYLPKPKSTPRRVVDAVKKPDLDKLVRCAKDGLTRGGVYHDDSQVVAVVARKDFAADVFDPLEARGLPRMEVIVGECVLAWANGGPKQLFTEAVGGGSPGAPS